MKPCAKCQQRPCRPSHTWCSPCYNEYLRAWRKTHPTTPKERTKRNARKLAQVYTKRGHLTAQPCEECGATPAEKHHEDYSQPLNVRWLCRPHHLALHRGAKHITTSLRGET